MWHKNAGTTFVLSQMTRLTEIRTDRVLTRPRLHSIQRSKNKPALKMET